MSELVENIETELNLNDSFFDEEDNPSRTLALVQEHWINEKFAPEILPHINHILETLFCQINFMEDNLQEGELENNDFRLPLYQYEIDRMRYLASSYLRTRLEKIERYAVSILNTENPQVDVIQNLTEEELEFATEYKQSIEQHFSNCLSFCTEPLVDYKTKQFLQPNLHTFVFAKSRRNIDGVVIDEDAVADIKEGSQMIVAYSNIAHLLRNGDVYLI